MVMEASSRPSWGSFPWGSEGGRPVREAPRPLGILYDSLLLGPHFCKPMFPLALRWGSKAARVSGRFIRTPRG